VLAGRGAIRLPRTSGHFTVRQREAHMPMNEFRPKIGFLLLIATLAAFLSGCATNPDAQQQSNDQTTLSGYIDTGAQKNFK
jgi:hypothetical protein